MGVPTAILLQNTDFLEAYLQKGYIFSDLGAFFENLEVWGKGDWLDNLFSSPIPGIKQNLANIKNISVGLYGERLLEKDILEKIISKYTQLGYHTILVDKEGNKKIFIAQEQKNMKVK